MSSWHQVSIWTPQGGGFLGDLSDFLSLECVMVEMKVGTLKVELPDTRNFNLFRRDARIAYYRAPSGDFTTGGPRMRLVGNTTWLVVKRQRTVNESGAQTVTILAVHPNHLLSRRVVYADEGTPESDKTGTADNLIKEYVRENFVSSSDTSRNWSSTLFTVDGDLSRAPSVSKSASYASVLTTCQELAGSGTTAGTYTGFEVSGLENGPFNLRTYTGQRGANRSFSSGNSLIISVAQGQLSNVELEEDWSEMATFVLAGGAGTDDGRIITASWDTPLIKGSPYGLIEYFQNAGSTDDPAIVTDEADRALRERRPRRIFTGTVRDSARATFGEEYDWGDLVVGEYARPFPNNAGFTDFQQFDSRVDPVRSRVIRTGTSKSGLPIFREALDIRLRDES